MTKKKSKKRAFTIVELVVVIAIIAILAAVLIPTFVNLVKRANEANALLEAKNLITEMLAEMLLGKEGDADLLVFSQKGNDVYAYGYDASAGRILAYKGNPVPVKSGTFADFVGTGKENSGGDTPLLALMLKNGEIEVNTAVNMTEGSTDWRTPAEVKKIVDSLNTKYNMIVFANYLITENFAKKESGGEEVHTHVWSTEWTKNSTHHWHDCTAEGCTVTVDSEKDGYGEHTFNDWTVVKPATETEKGSEKHKCSTCGYEESREIPVLTHTHSLTKVEAKAETCTEKGNKEYWRCSGCGKYFTDEAGTKETTLEALTISAKGHTYKYTDNGDGSTHEVTCEKGDLSKDSENHDFDADGKCTKCGYQKSTLDFSKPVYLYKSGTFSIESANTTSAKISYTNPAKTFDKIADALNEADAGDCIKLNGDLAESVTLKKSITLDLNGKTLTGGSGSVISFYEYGTSVITLNLFDSGSTGKITGGVAENGGGIYVINGTLNMYGGNITGNTANSGGGVAVISKSGKSAEFEMYGGKINGNFGKSQGFGVYVKVNDSTDPSASFKLHGGEVNENKAATDGYSQTYGGGVYVKGYYIYGKEGVKSIFEMTGGTINRNEAVFGGGAYLDANTQATISGGSIIGNVAKIETTSTGGQGGGIYVKEATLTLSKVTISENKAQGVKHGMGGGICADSSDVTVRAETVISRNSVSATQAGNLEWLSASGAGIYWHNTASSTNRLKLLGGVITDNKIESNNTGNSCAGAGIACAGTGRDATYYPHIEISSTCNISDNTGALKGNQVYAFKINVNTDRTDFSTTVTCDFVYTSSAITNKTFD